MNDREHGRKTYTAVKHIVGGIFLVVLFLLLLKINITESRNEDYLPQTAAEGRWHDITYFSDFSMETFDGGEFGTEDLKNARITVLNAWGPYCVNCLDEMPYLDEMNGELKDRGIQIVGIQSDAYEFPEDMELARKEAEDTGITYPLLIADSDYNEQLRPLLSNMLPGTWIVDSDGRILDFVQGGKTKDAWMKYLEPYLRQEET